MKTLIKINFYLKKINLFILKSVALIFLFLLAAVGVFILGMILQKPEPEEHITLVQNIVEKHIEKAYINYGLKNRGGGGGFLNKKVNLVSRLFDVNGPMDIKNSRKMIVNQSKELLKEILFEEKLHKYF